MTVGARIKAARENTKMTQTELGNKIGVSGVAIMRYEKDQRQPRLDQLQQIADVLGVPFYSLLIVKNTDTDFKLVQDYLGLTETALQTLTNGIRTFPGGGFPYSDKRTLIDVLNSVLSDSMNFLTMLTYIRIATATSTALWTWGNGPPTEGAVNFESEQYADLACERLRAIIKSISRQSLTATVPTSHVSSEEPTTPSDE